jgi:hypothetical protein
MIINVIERNGSDCKHVEIFTHGVGSTGAPSRIYLVERQTPNYGKSLRLIIIMIIIICNI